MPIYSNPIAGMLQPQEGDSAIVSGLKSAGRFLGLDDPNSVMTVAAPLEAPLVSMYKDAAARAAGTQAFLDSAKEFAKNNFAPKVQEAAEYLASKYPRVAAHMKVSPEMDPMTTAQAYIDWRQPAPYPMTYGINASQVGPTYNAYNTIAHEATHAAQRLGGGAKIPDLYDLATSSVGYADNPFEVTAGNRGMREAFKAYGQEPGLEDMANIEVKRPTIQVPTPELEETRRAMANLKGTLYDTADQRGLLQDIANRQQAEIPSVPYTALRGLKAIADKMDPFGQLQLASKLGLK